MQGLPELRHPPPHEPDWLLPVASPPCCLPSLPDCCAASMRYLQCSLHKIVKQVPAKAKTCLLIRVEMQPYMEYQLPV